MLLHKRKIFIVILICIVFLLGFINLNSIACQAKDLHQVKRIDHACCHDVNNSYSNDIDANHTNNKSCNHCSSLPPSSEKVFPASVISKLNIDFEAISNMHSVVFKPLFLAYKAENVRFKDVLCLNLNLDKLRTVILLN